MAELHSFFDIAELAGKFLKGTITREERVYLEAWIAQSDQNKALWEKLTRQEYLQQQLESWEEGDPEAAWKELLPAIRSAPPAGKVLAIKRYTRYTAAAMILLLAGSVAYIAYKNRRTPVSKTEAPVTALNLVKSIPPGSHSAQLVLSNGKVVGLGVAGAQKIREVNGTAVENALNILKYASAGVNLKGNDCYNSVITPRGGEYQLLLSDGTRVWLNAASSIRYPVCFTGKERRVTLVGEAYFEIAKGANQPFIVTTRQTEITVLGTSFNIKAYPDESEDKTSLVEGSVKVSAGTSDALLQPGREAVVARGAGIKVSSANLEEALAWKNGMFVFQSESLESIARKLSRWYNVDMIFGDPELRHIRFTGRLRRYDNMNSLLDIIEATSRVTFTQRGLQVLVGAR